ncbi:hypothetical protein WN944_007454 [Citrus x changshan-huyou]|uniref:Uncharacterized protein n=1 Tax=Citrus x changshan-huyou TaxID=2935761 RepID=A0AAP0ML24_9ROSI
MLSISMSWEDTFPGQVLGAVIFHSNPHLNQMYKSKSLKIISDGDKSKVGQKCQVDQRQYAVTGRYYDQEKDMEYATKQNR